MKNKPIFTGAATALITPTNSEGVDYPAFGKVIDWQIEQGIDGLIIAGTTGEGSTLSDEEHRAVVDYATERINGRVPVIAGTGSNDTSYAISLTKHCCESGVDGVLVVTPYYNKTTQDGLIAMYSAIADASSKPLILYNVPSRTGVNIEPQTYLALADHPMIQGIKEANGNISKIVEAFALVGDKLDIYSGNDDDIVPILSMGGLGVISVLSNLVPAEVSKLCKYALEDNDFVKAAEMQKKYLPLIRALFSEVNPIPTKCAMAKMGYCENYLRLPLVPMSKAKEEVLFSLMKEHALI